jgi:hypothetical protein
MPIVIVRAASSGSKRGLGIECGRGRERLRDRLCQTQRELRGHYAARPAQEQRVAEPSTQFGVREPETALLQRIYRFIQQHRAMIRDYGEERFAFQIAKALVARRAASELLTPG